MISVDEVEWRMNLLQKWEKENNQFSSVFSLVVPFRIVPKPRPQVTLHGTHMPKEYVRCRNNVSTLVRVAISKLSKWIQTGSYSLNARFCVQKSTDGDLDSLVGTLMDASNSVAWVDDRQVVRISSEKFIDKKRAFFCDMSVMFLAPTGFEPKSVRSSPQSAKKTTMTAQEFRNLSAKQKKRFR